MRKSQQKRLEFRLQSRLQFHQARKSFQGYLEGTQKSAHTIKNYLWDIDAFRDFLQGESPGHEIRCEALCDKDLARFHEFLKAQGFKTNTRRRRLLTAHRFVRFLSQRNKLLTPLPLKLPAPQKLERIPEVIPYLKLIEAIQGLSAATLLEKRNRALLWVLAETGCQVSEIAALRASDFDLKGSQVSFAGKKSRLVPISRALAKEIQGLGSDGLLFQGFNRHGSLGTQITSRGVELLVRAYATRLGLPKLTPRVFRHSTALYWLEQKTSRAEVQKRLGLKTDYVLRSYQPLLGR